MSCRECIPARPEAMVASLRASTCSAGALLIWVATPESRACRHVGLCCKSRGVAQAPLYACLLDSIESVGAELVGLISYLLTLS